MSISKIDLISDTSNLQQISIPDGERMVPKDRLLTARDLQYIFSVGKNRAYELLNSKAFPTIQIGGRKYVSWDALQKWIEIYSGRKYIC